LPEAHFRERPFHGDRIGLDKELAVQRQQAVIRRPRAGDIAGERRIVADRFNLLFLQRFAVQFVAQIKRKHNAVDFAPVAVAQRIAAVAFERIVFENFGLRR